MKKYTILVTGYSYDFYDEEEIEILAETDDEALSVARRLTNLNFPIPIIDKIEPCNSAE